MHTNELAIIDHDKYDLNVIYRALAHVYTTCVYLPVCTYAQHTISEYYNVCVQCPLLYYTYVI